MKDKGLKILSLIIVLSVVFGLCACGDDGDSDEIQTTNRSVTVSSQNDKTVKTTDENVVAVAPEGEQEILNYFNNALKLFKNSTFDFSKKDECSLTSYSAGSLNDVSGATDSYKKTLKSAVGDMVGVNSLETTYFAGDDITNVFAIKELSLENATNISAQAQGSQVTVEFDVTQNAVDGSDAVSAVTKNYLTNETLNSKISSYGATAQGTSVRISNVKLKAVIDYSTKNFISIDISFNTQFSISNLALDYVSGGPVAGSTKTTIKYKDFKEI